VVVAVQISGRKIQIRSQPQMVKILNSLHVPLLVVAQVVAYLAHRTRMVEMVVLAAVAEHIQEPAVGR
jgi:hypothetical protein